MKRKQPTNLTLLVTTVLCATLLAWAYCDRASRAHIASVDASVAAPDLVPLKAASAGWPPAVAPVLDVPSFDPPAPARQAKAPPAAADIYRLPLPREGDRAPSMHPANAGLSNVALWPALPQPEAPAADSPRELAADDPGAQADLGELAPALDEPAEAEGATRDDASTTAATPSPGNSPDAKSAAPRELGDDEAAVDAATPDLGEIADDGAAKAAARAAGDELLAYTPAATGISERVADDVRAAYSLGRHGALFAARERFVDAMRVIAAAKDAAGATDRHSQALSQGLTAVEEATDFLPRSDALEAELSVAQIASSHSTPLLHGAERLGRRLPHEAAALYYRYAEEKLASAVGGEQAGSMALCGLGKCYTRLADLDESPAAQQQSLAMYRAALSAHQGNYLAANELGVALARGGRYVHAAGALEHAVALGGGSTVYRNLAHVQHKLGQARLAAATAQHAERLAISERQAGEFSRARGVEWVSPDRFARRPGAIGGAAPAGPAETGGAAGQSPWDSVVRFAKRLAGDSPHPQPYPPVERNQVAPPVRSRTTVR